MNMIEMVAQTFVKRWDAIVTGTGEHLVLSFVAIAIATLVSIPLGLLLSRKRKMAEPMISITGIFQTIPSLALLAFMLPIFGIGKTPAIIALTVYALLPILRNTYIGVINVDKSVIEAGRGMGMTANQILFKIELPLALPVIMAGVRTATVMTIGVATLAAFIGAGGLGDLIFRGMSMMRNELVLAGAIPAAILAIFFDFLLKRFENWATPKGVRK